MLPDQQSRWESIFRWITAPHPTLISPRVIAGRSVLVTGAGGSIGSTLAREAGRLNPRQLVLLDASEQSLFRIDRELDAPHTVVLGSVCDRVLLEETLARFQPEIVIHAAAFKHVPLMEFNPFAAVQNNALGTFTVAESAANYGVEQLVMVSTDKAVEPASIMGASKRIAELVVLAMSSRVTQFKAVRLGNVLASEGSVLPLFQQQIELGQPIGVTHPEASRYFLTLQQAAHLLLLALADEFGSGILIPELGDPVRIEEIAARLLAASPESPSRIIFTGLRPGDKLTEKLVSTRESFLSDDPSPLRAIDSLSLPFHKLEQAINEIERAVQERNLSELLSLVMKLVPDYRPSAVIQSAVQFTQEEHAAMRPNR